MPDTLTIALDYIRRGWNITPVPFQGKGPTDAGWQKRVITEADAPRYFSNGPINIGVILGEPSDGLADIDLDCDTARIAAPYILPKTGAIFGRQTSRASHWLYKTDLARVAETAVSAFNDINGERLLELRTGAPNAAAQTIFPGSTHPSGEPVAWEEAGAPAAVDGLELETRARRLAACALLARHWPNDGARHDTARVLGGFLARCGLPRETIKCMVTGMCRAAGDDEPRDRVKAAEDAAVAFHQGRHAFGLIGMREKFGDKVADRAAEWLHYRGGAEAAEQQRFDETPQEQQAPLIQSSAQFVKDFVPPDYLIDGLLQRRFIYSFTARTGGGKTAIVLLFAALVGLSQKLGSREVAKGRALILAGENPDDVRMRWIAMAQQMGFDENAIDVHFVPGALKLSTMMARIRREAEAIGDLTLVVVDTSAAYFEGDDENSNVQAAVHARRLRTLVELPGGPCVIVTCHPTKNAPDDNLLPRGGGAFLNEVDGNLTAVRTDMSIEMHWQGKYRGPDFPPIGFILRSVTHQDLKDSGGKLIPTVVAKHLSDAEQEDLKRVAQTDDTQLLKAIAENNSASLTDLAKTLGWYMKSGEPYRSKVVRTLTRLKKFRLVIAQHDGLALTKAGEKALKKITENVR